MANQHENFVEVYFKPFNTIIKIAKGSTILDASLKAGIHINASCGGSGNCGKCLVTIKQGVVEGGITEKIKLSDSNKGIRQACLAKLTEDVIIEVNIESILDLTDLKNLATGSLQTAILIDSEILKKNGLFDPAITKIIVNATPPSKKDNRNDVHRLLSALRELGEINFSFEFEAIRDLPIAWREGDWQVTTTIMRPAKRKGGRNQVIRVEPGNTTTHNIAAVIDLGTTTIWGQLIDLNNGKILATEGNFNSQISYGEDVISRIIYAAKPGGLKHLQKAASNSINNILKILFYRTGINLNDISLMTLAGNTIMTQLFLGIEPRYIRLEPYVPAAAYYPPLKANDFDLTLPDHVRLLIFPTVASYVGGDVVAGIIGSGIHKDNRLTLYIDLGTNGEVVVGNRDWMACAAASAGPAFEGGGIKFGMHATSGAIENFSLNPFTNEPGIVTIARVKPKGICGSGLIASVAALYSAGIIDERGYFNTNHYTPRIRDGEDGKEYVLAWAQNTQIGRDIVLTEADIKNFIRAKGAMYAAYITLLENVGLNIQDLERVVLAGGFGQSIKLEQAIMIGLLPELPLKRFIFIGNGSLLGARQIALSNSLRAEVGDIVDKMTNFELSTASNYMKNYISSLFLPHTNSNFLFPQTMKRIHELRRILINN